MKEENVESYCQSFLMCVRCASLFLKATAHELQVYGCVCEISGVASIVEGSSIVAPRCRLDV